MKSDVMISGAAITQLIDGKLIAISFDGCLRHLSNTNGKYLLDTASQMCSFLLFFVLYLCLLNIFCVFDY